MSGSARFPVPKFYFSVNIDGYDVSFQEITGLDQEFEFIEYRAGNEPELLKFKRAGLMKTGQISCKKGVFKCDENVFNIFDPLYEGKGDKYRSGSSGVDMTITLKDESDNNVITWNVVGAIPIKMSNGNLKADESAIAIEQIDFVFEKITSQFS